MRTYYSMQLLQLLLLATAQASLQGSNDPLISLHSPPAGDSSPAASNDSSNTNSQPPSSLLESTPSSLLTVREEYADTPDFRKGVKYPPLKGGYLLNEDVTMVENFGLFKDHVGHDVAGHVTDFSDMFDFSNLEMYVALFAQRCSLLVAPLLIVRSARRYHRALVANSLQQRQQVLGRDAPPRAGAQGVPDAARQHPRCF